MIFQEKVSENNCKLMGGFAIVVQITMACVALLSLLLKRHFENPKRPLIIWAMDTSKQAVAASLVHITNIFVSLFSQLLGGGENSSNPCSWYFLNLFLDTTIGVYILYLFLTAINYFCVRFLGISDIETGVYGNPPRFLPWFKQLLIFLLSWLWVKLSVVLILVMMPFFNAFALWVLSMFKDNVDAQIFFVMFCFPLAMNIVQAVLTDRIIKGNMRQKISANNSIPATEPDMDEERPLIPEQPIQSIEEVPEHLPIDVDVLSINNSLLQKLSHLFGRSRKTRQNSNENDQLN